MVRFNHNTRAANPNRRVYQDVAYMFGIGALAVGGLAACSNSPDISITVNCAHGSNDQSAARQIGSNDHTADFYDKASGEDITEDVQYVDSGGTFMQLGTLGTVNDGETVATGTYIKVVAGADGKPGFTLSCIKEVPAASPAATHS